MKLSFTRKNVPNLQYDRKYIKIKKGKLRLCNSVDIFIAMKHFVYTLLKL